LNNNNQCVYDFPRRNDGFGRSLTLYCYLAADETIMMAMACFFWATGIFAFQNAHLMIEIHSTKATSALQTRASESYYTSNPQRREVRRDSKQYIKSTSNASSGKMRQERTVVIMYHKPPNVITSHSNADAVSQTQTEQSRRTVYEDIYTMQGFVSDQVIDKEAFNFERATSIQSKLHAIGRLDADTTGLLLLTNDGDLVHQITNPNAKQDNYQTKPVRKTYQALIMGHHELPESSTTTPSNYEVYPLATLLEKGATLSPKHGGQTKPVDDLTILSHPTSTTTLVSITISEGKNRQIRRMFHSIGSGVMKLHRVSIGKLTLMGLSKNPTQELEEGEWRLLTENEIKLGLGWDCRLLDKVSPLADGRRSRARGKRQSKTTRSAEGRRRR